MLTKAEVLWTRKCPLSCSYCNMKTGEANSKDIKFWREGVDNLKELDCQFIAIYGAEPLADFDLLPLFVKKVSESNIDMTLITSCIDAHLYEKLNILHACGLHSLTCSYDIIPLDKSSKAKSDKAIDTLEWFAIKPYVDNVAAVVTLTRHNYKHLYNAVKMLSAKGIWTFFDIIHPDRGQPGAKCKGDCKEFLFEANDIPLLIEELRRIKADKTLMFHNSENFIDYLDNNRMALLDFSWHCTKRPSFPAWVTVNCDGQVYPCDDFQMPELGVPLNKLAKNFHKLSKKWTHLTNKHCPGCMWNTHFDAHEIAEGKLDINKYVHKDEKI